MENKDKRVENMILMKGIDPRLDLGIEWTEDDNFSIPLCSVSDEKVVVLGRMELSSLNLSKIKSYNWRYLEREPEGKWEAKDLDISRIPRPMPSKDELIRVSISEESTDEEDIIF